MVSEVLENAKSQEKLISMQNISDKRKAALVSELYKNTLLEIKNKYDYEVTHLGDEFNELNAQVQLLRGEIDIGMEPVAKALLGISEERYTMEQRLIILADREVVIARKEEDMRLTGLKIQQMRVNLKDTINDSAVISSNVRSKVLEADIRVAELDKKSKDLDKRTLAFNKEKREWDIQKLSEESNLKELRDAYQAMQVIR